MLMSGFVEHVEEDLAVFGELGGPEIRAVVERLTSAVGPALQSRFLEALNALVQEYNTETAQPLFLTLDGDHVRLAPVTPMESPLQPPTANELNARIALRVSEEMKQKFERSARSGGISVNSWIVRTLDRALRSDPSTQSSHRASRMKGVGQA
jgi:hypothetical protein